jgi:hypothetical protein
MKEEHPRILLLYVPTNYIVKFQPVDVVLQGPLKCSFVDMFKHWSAKQIQQMVATSVPTSPMKVDNSMETICENATDWLFMAHDKLCIHKEMIASSWGRCGILKMWD